MLLKVNRFSKFHITKQKDGKDFQKEDLRFVNNLLYNDSGKQKIETARVSFYMLNSARKCV